SFTIPVLGQDEKSRDEAFEWHLSHGKEVQIIDNRAWGYRLVSLAKGEACQAGSSRDAREHGWTSDGKESVAVYADRSKTDKHKVASLCVCREGTGGELGEKWAICAVATFLRLWQSVNQALSGRV
ncbi:hypothetical protein DOTSEDRAFT_131649, partial [Dothistroma septosporum NZE10]